MLKFESDYLELLINCIDRGERLPSRNGTILMLSGPQLNIDLQDGFPLLSGKQIFPKHFLHELKWMLNGDTNTKYLNEHGSKIWDKWADKNGDLGPVYGKQFRNFGGVDQIQELIRNLSNIPYSRRHIISLWNPADLDKMALPPCFYSFQVIVKRNTVDLIVSQRSADVFIGLPYDVCFYSVFLNLIVNTMNQSGVLRLPGRVIVNIGNAHVYEGHLLASREYISRFPIALTAGNPQIAFKFTCGILDYDPKDISFKDYFPLPFIPAEVYE